MNYKTNEELSILIKKATAGDILDISPEAYRQRLSRIRGKMADFLKEYCGEYGNGNCRCAKRINYAIQNHRITPTNIHKI